MDSSQTAPPSQKRLWLGRIVSALPVLLLFLSAIMKFAKLPSVMQGIAHYGVPASLLVTLGILEFGSALVYAIPATSFLGAILVTGYLGGATATNIRVGDSWIMPVLLGVLAWLGLFLRDDRLRALVPLRR